MAATIRNPGFDDNSEWVFDACFWADYKGQFEADFSLTGDFYQSNIGTIEGGVYDVTFTIGGVAAFTDVDVDLGGDSVHIGSGEGSGEKTVRITAGAVDTLTFSFASSSALDVMTIDNVSIEMIHFETVSSVDGSFGSLNLVWLWLKNWAMLEAADGNFVAQDGVAPYLYYVKSYTSDKWTYKIHGGFTFDISAIPAGAKITGVTEKLYGQAKTNDFKLFEGELGLYSFNPGNKETYAVGDYANIGTDFLSDTTYTYNSWQVHTVTPALALNEFTYNSTGIAAVQAALDGDGLFCHCCRELNYDVGVNTPVSEFDKTFRLLFHGHVAAVGFRPTLLITYTYISGRGPLIDGSLAGRSSLIDGVLIS